MADGDLVRPPAISRRSRQLSGCASCGSCASAVRRDFAESLGFCGLRTAFCSAGQGAEALAGCQAGAKQLKDGPKRSKEVQRCRLGRPRRHLRCPATQSRCLHQAIPSTCRVAGFSSRIDLFQKDILFSLDMSLRPTCRCPGL